ncbi:MAG TPA: hypothetical protein ENK98_02235 [Epsilonproteobacteria bacterium]|nr:hypothetical protein [Campylobacterota bacterium]
MKHFIMSVLELFTATLLFLSATAAFIVTVPFHLVISLLFWVLTGELTWNIDKSDTMRKLYGK